MIELYSTDIAAVNGMTIEWETKSIQYGNTATLASDKKTINLNVPGVYEVTVSGYGSTTAAGSFAFQLSGVSEIARGSTEQSTGAGEYGSVSFTILIGVSATAANTDKAALTLDYVGSAGNIELVDIVVKKVL